MPPTKMGFYQGLVTPKPGFMHNRFDPWSGLPGMKRSAVQADLPDFIRPNPQMVDALAKADKELQPYQQLMKEGVAFVPQKDGPPVPADPAKAQTVAAEIAADPPPAVTTIDREPDQEPLVVTTTPKTVTINTAAEPPVEIDVSEPPTEIDPTAPVAVADPRQKAEPLTTFDINAWTGGLGGVEGQDIIPATLAPAAEPEESVVVQTETEKFIDDLLNEEQAPLPDVSISDEDRQITDILGTITEYLGYVGYAAANYEALKTFLKTGQPNLAGKSWGGATNVGKSAFEALKKLQGIWKSPAVTVEVLFDIEQVLAKGELPTMTGKGVVEGTKVAPRAVKQVSTLEKIVADAAVRDVIKLQADAKAVEQVVKLQDDALKPKIAEPSPASKASAQKALKSLENADDILKKTAVSGSDDLLAKNKLTKGFRSSVKRNFKAIKVAGLTDVQIKFFLNWLKVQRDLMKNLTQSVLQSTRKLLLKTAKQLTKESAKVIARALARLIK